MVGGESRAWEGGLTTVFGRFRHSLECLHALRRHLELTGNPALVSQRPKERDDLMATSVEDPGPEEGDRPRESDEEEGGTRGTDVGGRRAREDLKARDDGLEGGLVPLGRLQGRRPDDGPDPREALACHEGNDLGDRDALVDDHEHGGARV